jgi:hypothetical protein
VPLCSISRPTSHPSSPPPPGPGEAASSRFARFPTKRQDAASTSSSTPTKAGGEVLFATPPAPSRFPRRPPDSRATRTDSRAAIPIPAPPSRFPRRPPDPRATRTAKLQRARVARVFVAKAASHRPSTAHSAAALAEASRSDHAAGFCQRNKGPAPVPRRPDREASASARRQGFRRQGRVTTARPPPVPPLRLLKLRAPTMPPGLSKEHRACPRPASFVPRPFSHKAAGCRFHFRLHADQSGGRGPARYSTCRHPDSRAARPIPASPGPRSFSERASPRFSSPRPRRQGFRRQGRVTPPVPPLRLLKLRAPTMPPGLSKEHRACPRPASFAPPSLYAQSGRMPLPLQAPRRPKRGARSRTLLHLPPPGSSATRSIPAPLSRFQRRPPDSRAARTAKLQRARVAKVFVAKAASHRPSTAHSAAALAEASRSDHAAGGCQRNIGPAPVPRPAPPSLFAQSGRMPLPLLLLTPPPSTAATAPVPFRTKRQDAASTSGSTPTKAGGEVPHATPPAPSRFPRRPPDSRTARPIPAPPGPIPAPPGPRSFSERASPRFSSPRPRRQGRVAARPPPRPPLRLLKLRAPTMPPGLSKEHRACPRPAPPGPRSFSERASPGFSSPRPRHTARPPPVPPLRLLKLRAPTMPPGFVKGT